MTDDREMLNYRGGERVSALGLIMNTSSRVPSAPFPSPCLGRTSFQDKPGHTRAFSWQTPHQKAFPTFWDEYFRSPFLSSNLQFLPHLQSADDRPQLDWKKEDIKDFFFKKNCFHIKRFEVSQFVFTRTSLPDTHLTGAVQETLLAWRGAAENRKVNSLFLKLIL